MPDWASRDSQPSRLVYLPDAVAAVKAAFAAGRAAATPDPPTDERRPWPIAPDTVMPPRRQPVRWGSRADDPPTEIHDDPGKTKAYLAGLAAGRTEAAAASPDERLREAAEALSIIYVMLMGAEPIWAEMPVEERCARAANEAQQAFLSLDAALAVADREAPDEGQTFTASVTMGQHREGCDPTKRDRYGLVCWGCADAPPVSDEQEKP